MWYAAIKSNLFVNLSSIKSRFPTPQYVHILLLCDTSYFTFLFTIILEKYRYNLNKSPFWALISFIALVLQVSISMKFGNFWYILLSTNTFCRTNSNEITMKLCTAYMYMLFILLAWISPIKSNICAHYRELKV